MNNIFKLTAVEDKVTTKNLFKLYAQANKCAVDELAQLLLTLNSIATSVARQMQVYYFIKNHDQNWVSNEMTKYFKRVYEIRRQYDWQVWYCHRDTPANAKTIVRRVMHESHLTGSDLTYTLHQNLSRLYPVYKWAVVQYQEVGNIKLCQKTMESRGEQYFTVSTKNQNILVVYKDHNETHHDCSYIRDLSTFIPFAFYSGCDEGNPQATQYLLNGKLCKEVLSLEFHRLFGNCKYPNSLYVSQAIVNAEVARRRLSFLAAGVKHNDPCLQGQILCGGRGECQHIPHTNKHMCICDPFYEGQECSNYQTLENVNNATKLLSQLRSNFANLTGIPNAIDVYFEVRKLPLKMKALQTNLIESIKYNRLISLYGSVITEAEFISLNYNKLLSGKISERTFLRHIAHRDFPYILNGLETMVLGKGSLASLDLIASIKHVWIAENGQEYSCSEKYGKTISIMMKAISTLDQSITEAYFRMNTWKICQLKDSRLRRDLLQHIKHVAETAKNRQNQYKQYWKKTSCGKLTDDKNVTERFCDKEQSYEGMTVALHCNKNMNISVPSATCRRDNGILKWTSNPKCDYLWGSWSSWSTCSQTCEKGTQKRTRSKLNGEIDTGIRSCIIGKYPCIDYIWTEWGSCSTTCGTGKQTRTRRKHTEELEADIKLCLNHPCIHYNWSPWSSCSKTCDIGKQSRTRKRAPPGEKTINIKSCHGHPCHDYIWSHWSSCSKTCDIGRQSRTRKRAPPGEKTTDIRSCHGHPCSHYSWSRWSSCSKRCATGRQSRTRSRAPYGGHKYESRHCNAFTCPWSSWSGHCGKRIFGRCRGTKIRSRTLQDGRVQSQSRGCHRSECRRFWG